MRIGWILRQTALWQKKIPASEDQFGMPQWEPPVEILVRAVRQHATFSDDRMGNIVTSDYIVWTENNIKIEDKITVNGDELTVIAEKMNDLVWIDGKRIGSVLYCSMKRL